MTARRRKDRDWEDDRGPSWDLTIVSFGAKLQKYPWDCIDVSFKTERPAERTDYSMAHTVDGLLCYTSGEAATYLRMNPSTFHWNVHRGNIVPDRRVGRVPLFTIATLKDFRHKREEG